MRPEPVALVERSGVGAGVLPEDVLCSTEPVLLRGLADHWPMVQAARRSDQEAVAYLRGFEREGAPPIVATVAEPSIEGRFFYSDDFTGFNFHREKASLGATLDALLGYAQRPDPPAVYIGSTTIDTWLPGFRDVNDLAFGGRSPLASIWIGNRSRICAHQDLPENIACVVAGRRRVTLFPPEQLSNLYVGPLDHTPAGQAVSLVDLANPDLASFPRFAEALAHARVAELGPGDAVFIPSMWWHHIEALDTFNVLVNYWWRNVPAWMDTPMNALMLAIMTIRDLPPSQRATWAETFRHYVFEAGESTVAHIPEVARGLLAPMDEGMARSLRARLLQRINR